LHVPGRSETLQRVFCRIEPGDVLRVRESWRTNVELDGVKPSEIPSGAPIRYMADDTIVGDPPRAGWGRGRPSIFLPKWASRLRLTVIEVKAEKLQWITGQGVLAEGIDSGNSNPAVGECWQKMQRMAFEQQWDRLNKRGGGASSWAANPWVWVVRFQRSGVQHANELPVDYAVRP
jgi:hypothetical protein